MTSSTSSSARPVVIDPRFALEARDLDDFLGEFGPFNGRYVPRYPRDWSDRLKRHLDELSLDSLPPVRRQAMLERIRRELPLCLDPVGWAWDDAHAWADNVQSALAGGAQPIVVGQALDPTPFLSWPQALYDIRETRRRSWPFHGRPSDYVAACRPLLVNSPAAYLVDPYLNVFTQKAEVLLRSLFEAAKGSRCYAIEIITRQSAYPREGAHDKPQSMTKEAIEAQLRKTYSGLLPKDRALKLHLVLEGQKGGPALRLHDRFFITRYGSISFGQGFEVSPQSVAQQNAFVIDQEHHLALQRTYIDGVALHDQRLPRVPGIAYPLGVHTICV